MQVRKTFSIQPVVDDADHGVAAGEERGHVGGLGARVEALVPGEDPVAEVLLVGVQEPRDGVGVQPRTEGTDVKLKQKVVLTDKIQWLYCNTTEHSRQVLPRRVRRCCEGSLGCRA